jgi:hypothetical protein
MTSTAPSSADAANVGRAAKANAIRSLLLSVVINGALPFLIYWAMTNYTSVSSFIALVASGIPSLIHSLTGLLRQKRIDFLAGIVLAGIVISLVITLLGGDPKIYLIRESFFTITFGLILLISLALPRPIMFYIARHFASGNDPVNIAHFDQLWQEERVRRLMRVLTAVWGVGFLLEAVIRIALVLTLSVQQFLVVSPFMIYGIIAILVIWTFRYGRGGRAPTQRVAEEEPAASTTAIPTENT